MKIYLTRHGQTQANAENKFQGWIDTPLTENGIKAAEDLRDFIKGKKVDFIACSTLLRAKTTAEILKGDNTWPIYYYDELRELNFGDWEGKTLPSLQHTKQYHNFFNKPSEFKVPNAEDFWELRGRVINKIEELYSEYPNKTVFIVAHGLVVRILLCHFHKTEMDMLHQTKYPYGCSFTEMRYDGQHDLEIITECQTDHYSSEDLKSF